MTGRRRAEEAARRLYAELVRGRTRVRVVPQGTGDATTPARFLLSPYRSGTTLLRYCLDSHPRLAVPPETDFLLPLLAVLDDEPSLTGLRDLGYDEEAAVRSLDAFGRSFLDDYAASRHADAGWLDKSPRYAEHPDVIANAFPDARLVIMHRNPLDQIHSFIKAGAAEHPGLAQVAGEDLLDRVAVYWTEVTEALDAVATAHRDRAVTITYEQLCADPPTTLRSVVEHLGLEWDPAVLDHDRYEHDKGREAGRVAGTRGFVASGGGWRAWPEHDVARVRARVAATARRLGYDV